MPLPPFVTCVTTFSSFGRSSSRLGPRCRSRSPAFIVWQSPQPASANTLRRASRHRRSSSPESPLPPPHPTMRKIATSEARGRSRAGRFGASGDIEAKSPVESETTTDRPGVQYGSRGGLDTAQYSLVLPIYNEEATIPELVRRLGELDGQARRRRRGDPRGRREQRFELRADGCRPRDRSTLQAAPALAELRAPDRGHRRPRRCVRRRGDRDGRRPAGSAGSRTRPGRALAGGLRRRLRRSRGAARRVGSSARRQRASTASSSG